MVTVRGCLPALLIAACGLSCTPGAGERPPSIALIVIDTLRADAVSSYGRVAGTTPELDRLAAGGVRFAHAYAPAPWTLPSHASLFTGLGPEEHGVGIRRRVTLAEGFRTLAERLAAAGYETIGFSENPFVSADFGMTRGFARFEAASMDQVIQDFREPGSSDFDTAERVAAWARGRDDERPYFLFVNVLDAHEPYTVREHNAFLPSSISRQQASEVEQSPTRICDAVPSPGELAILSGLYLGDVAAADRKLARITGALRSSAGQRNTITVVTSDHGEHLGEDRLLDHQFSLHEVLLHVPLIVHGLPATAAAVVEEPVSLVDIAPSVLAWTGQTPAPELPGRTLPSGSSPDAAAARDLFALYGDAGELGVLDWPETMPTPGTGQKRPKRARCGPSDRVFGDMVSLLRYPLQLVWYERYPPHLYEVADGAPPPTAPPAMRERLEAFVAAARLDAADGDDAKVPPAAVDALKSLGYLD